MKRIFLLMASLMVVAVIAGCSSDKKTDSESEVEDKGPVTYVTPQSVTEKIENKETFAFVLGDETCSACSHYKENALTEMVKKDSIKLGFVELNGIEEKKDEMDSIIYLIEKHLDSQFEATPTTYFIVDGVMKEAVVGSVPYDELKETYESHINSDDTEKNDVEEIQEDEKVEETEEEKEDTR